MPRPTPLPFPSRRPRLALRLTAASVIAVAAVWGAWAQQSPGLRGAVPDDEAALASPAADDRFDAQDATDAQAADDDPLDDTVDAETDDGLAAPAARPRPPAATRQPRTGSTPSPTAATGEADDAEAGLAANARLAPQEEAGDRDDADPGGRAERALAIEALPRADIVETSPFEALGIRAGGMILRPSVETGLTASSNAARTANGSSGVLSETTLRLDARSDWSEHTATLDGFGTFRRSLSGEDEVHETEGGIDGALRFDLGDEWAARAGLAYAVRPETASSVDAVANAQAQPLRHNLRAEAGLDKALGKLRLAGTVAVERDWYGDAELAGGGTLDQSERNSTLGLVSLRTGYAVSPALTPFLEAEVGRRAYDEEGGTDRTARRLGARAGISLDLGEKLTGEAAVGWLRESFKDGDLAPVEGPSLLASLRWSPERETVVAFNAATTVEGTTTEGESGALVHDLRLEVERTLRANLTAEGGLGASFRDYTGGEGRDVTLVADVGATWWLNRWVGLSARLRHERLESSEPDREYRENSVFVGTRLQY